MTPIDCFPPHCAIVTSYIVADFSRIANNKQHQDEYCVCFAGISCLALLATGLATTERQDLLFPDSKTIQERIIGLSGTL